MELESWVAASPRPPYTMHRSVNLMVVVQSEYVRISGKEDKHRCESVLSVNLVIKPGRKRNNKSRS